MKKNLLRTSCMAAALAVLAGVGYVTASPGAVQAPALAEEGEHIYDAPTDLSAVKTAPGINLKWNSPQDRFNKLRVLESFESYASGEHENLAPWILIDEDGVPSAAPLGTIPIGTAFAWGVLSRESDAHTGKNSLGTMYCKQTAQSLDWLVSPVLNFGGQTISFWAMSSQAAFPESMEVRYSTGDAWVPDLMANEPLLTVDQVPATWTKYEVAIPAEARHFAIRCTSTDKTSLIVDDIIYWPGSLSTAESDRELGLPYDKLLGFNIYRNGEKVNDAPVFADEYLDVVEPGNYSYTVKAVYEDEAGQPVESEASNEASVSVETADMIFRSPLNLKGSSSVEGVSLTWEQPSLNDANLVPYTQTFDGTEAGNDALLDVEGPIEADTYNGLKLINRNGIEHINQGTSPWQRTTTGGYHNTGCLKTTYVSVQTDKTDSWIVTPKLNGRAQTVTFQYRSENIADPETFEVLYTTDIQDYLPEGTSMDDYGIWTLVESVVATSEEWQTMTVNLPEGATYFALRCTSGYCYTFFVDNLTYTPYVLPADAAPASAPARVILPLTGYNVYRDGVKINDTPIVDTEYLDSEVPTGAELTYTVTAVYGANESEPSAEAKVYILPDPVPEAVSAVLTPTGIAVEWNAPDLRYLNTVPSTEDFEGYTDFLPGGIDALDNLETQCTLGDWKMVNRAELQHNNNTQNFLPWFLDFSNGNVCLSTNYNGSQKQQDDWLISPLLSGVRQTITFDVKCENNNDGPEVLQILYTDSETCDVPEGKDFEEYGVWTVVETREISNMDWKQISFEVPRDATHFALRCLSKYKYTLSVDNISFATTEIHAPERALRQFKGYNVYIGEQKINESILTDTSFHIPAPGFGEHQIIVSSVFANSEAKSAPVNFIASAADIHLPIVQVINGETANGAITLSWEAPVAPELHYFTEDFSSATEEVTVNGDYNGWTAINANGNTHRPNACYNGVAQGENPWYIERDRDAADDEENPNFYLANGYNNNDYTDDWFISPRATGVKSVQFDARITHASFKDAIQVLASASNDPADLDKFTLVQTVNPASVTDWTNFSIDLPAGCKYFALRSYNEVKDGLNIDNIAWQRVITPAEGLLGYNLYSKYAEFEPAADPAEVATFSALEADAQGFEKVNDAPIAEASFKANLDPGKYQFLISAVYPWGESEMSPVFAIDHVTGIEGLKGDMNSSAAAVYYTIDGIRVDSPRPGNVYIELRGTKATKVFVK